MIFLAKDPPNSGQQLLMTSCQKEGRTNVGIPFDRIIRIGQIVASKFRPE
jgi:hypothetical protein